MPVEHDLAAPRLRRAPRPRPTSSSSGTAAGHAARVRHDAVGAERVAAVLDLEQRPRAKALARTCACRGGVGASSAEQLGDARRRPGSCRARRPRAPPGGRSAPGPAPPAQPVTTTTGVPGAPSACRTALRALASASPVTVQVFTTTTPASSSTTIASTRAEQCGGHRLALDAVDLAAERAEGHSPSRLRRRGRSDRRGAADCGSAVRLGDTHCEPPIPPSAAMARASATTAAVSVRRIVGPSDATTAPRAISAATSSALSPPSGPTTSATRAPSVRPQSGEGARDAGAAMLFPEHDSPIVAAKQLERVSERDRIGDARHTGPFGLLGG